MPRLYNGVPKYRRHRASGQAVVTIAGHDHYLGPHRSQVSHREYDRLVGEWLAAGRPGAQASPTAAPLTIDEVLARHWRFAQQHYRKNGQPTAELDNIRLALRPLQALFGHTAAADFGPLALKAVRRSVSGRGQSKDREDQAHVPLVRFRAVAAGNHIPGAVYPDRPATRPDRGSGSAARAACE